MTTEPVQHDLRHACPHCGAGPDSVIVRKRIIFYEHHAADCVTLERLVRS